MTTHRVVRSIPLSTLLVLAGTTLALAQPPATPAPAGGLLLPPGASVAPPAPDFPPFAEVSKDFQKVVSTADGSASLYTLWRREKDQRLIAELPRGYDNDRIFIATTIASGVRTAGIQLGETYAYWKRYNKKLALIQPDVDTRASGDAESKKAEERVFTDRVILEVPIIAIGPDGGPVIDLSAVLSQQADKFFGPAAARANTDLLRIASAKAFPKNIEIALEMPDRTGRLVTFHYSISEIPPRGSYQPREADPRVGFFTTAYRDVSRNDKDTQWVRYINRWHIEKRDPKLKMSPPKQPIVFYIDAATPVQYRRWVRDGILNWNKAFERVGIVDAIQVYQQDASTGDHLDKDPEDVRYNFVRWSNAELGFAIGPSRVHPETGQILDADVVIDDVFIRGWFRSYNSLTAELAMTGFGPNTLAWLDKNPLWDPRVRLASPAEREMMLQGRQLDTAQRVAAAMKKHRDPATASTPPLLSLRSGDPLAFNPIGTFDTPQRSDLSALRCSANLARSMDVALFRLSMDALELIQAAAEAAPDDEKKDTDKKEESKEQLLDGMPESFVGPLLADLVSHEVGHTLGLRHNFKASSIASLKDINSPAFKGQKTITGSVMDYNPININFKDGEVQGDYAMIGVGPYDLWAIEYGYSLDKDLKPILKRVSEADLPFATDEDVFGPDPLAKMFDLGKDSLDYADSQMRLVQFLRPKIIEKLVKPGESWQKARDAFNLLLARHMGSVRIASYYLGGADINRDKKGDPGNRPAVTPTPTAQQRRALKFIIDNTFADSAFGLDRELIARLGLERWWDGGGFRNLFEDPAWPIHDRVLAVQASALTAVMNPDTLMRIYDNEFLIKPGDDALTLPEVLDSLTSAIFSELDSGLARGTVREPAISSFRRNLQREHLNRLCDLVNSDSAFTAAYKPIQTLVAAKLTQLGEKLETAKNQAKDPYSSSHIAELSKRIKLALDPQVIYNADQIGGGGGSIIFFMSGDQPEPTTPKHTPEPAERTPE